MSRHVALLALVLTMTLWKPCPLPAQDEEAFRIPTTNPAAVVRQRIAATDVEVSFHRPRVRGRGIFGELVPFGRVWRTGSDNATRIRFTTEVRFGGREVPAGQYELFTVPGEEEWIVILTRDRGQWGSYGYDPGDDVVRVTTVPTVLGSPAESFTMAFEDVGTASAQLTISWDRTKVAVPIDIDLATTVIPQLERAVRSEGRPPYFLAAMFYFENDLDLDRAAELMEKALEQNPGHIGMLHRQALILEKMGRTTGAIEAAEQSLEGARAATGELREEYIRLNSRLLERLKGQGSAEPERPSLGGGANGV